MKNEKMTSQEAGLLLSKKRKQEIVSEHFHRLLNKAFRAIDEGKFNKDFCPGCVLNYVVEQNPDHGEHIGIIVANKRLPKKGNYEEYEIGRYLSDDDDYSDSPPIGDFDIELMVDNVIFDTPVNGKFNIDYPFHDILFEGAIVNAKSIGEILSQITNAFNTIYQFADGTNIGYNHGIDDLVYEGSIIIYANGTIEFSVGS